MDELNATDDELLRTITARIAEAVRPEKTKRTIYLSDGMVLREERRK